MTRCEDCENEDREGGQYCEACGAKIEPRSAEPPQFDRADTEGESAPPSAYAEDVAKAMGTDEGEADSGGLSWPEAASDPEGSAAEPEESKDEGWPEPTGDDEGAAAEGSVDVHDAIPTVAREEGEAEGPKVGYLVFPDSTEQPIPESQWLIGRADLSKYLRDPENASEISRGHLTVFQEGEKYYIEDGKTMVQERPSANKTWLVRGGSKILVTGTGRNELQDADEIDIAELVKLQFVAK